jgi:hypothetical protein
MLLADPNLSEQAQQEIRAVIRVAIHYGRTARGL